jgi:hypothetical protein
MLGSMDKAPRRLSDAATKKVLMAVSAKKRK